MQNIAKNAENCTKNAENCTKNVENYTKNRIIALKMQEICHAQH